jgi:hypothetical protein
MKKFRIAASVISLTAAAALLPLTVTAVNEAPAGGQAPAQESTPAVSSTVDVTAATAPVSETSTASTGEGSSEVTTEEPTPEPTTKEPVFYNITFLDFNGNIMDTLTVEEGAPIDYSKIDTSNMHKHIDVYTEQDFAMWDQTPQLAEKDLTIKALSKTATISLKKLPDRTRYYYPSSEISLAGLEVCITVETQTPVIDSNGKYVTQSVSIDISSSCGAQPSTVAEAFADGSDTAEITIYPIGERKPLASFNVNIIRGHGDVNKNGRTDAVDASSILKTYAALTADPNTPVSAEYKKAADVNFDGKIDAVDAAIVMKYYALASSHILPDWETLINTQK